ncbi:MAG TPA: hypothetical protein VNQ73_20975 [Ilumatobacter sp.]|nr:hypothetical protein [Ilumatobacter sp.]
MSEGHPRDVGITFVEVIIAVVIMGMLAVVLSAAMVVTMRESQSSNGRTSVARAEQSLATYLPIDLASATEVAPCSDCALLLRWDLDGVISEVVYRQSGDGTVTRTKTVDGDLVSEVKVVHDQVDDESFRVNDADKLQVAVAVTGGGRTGGRGGGVNTVLIEAARVLRCPSLDVDSTRNMPTLADIDDLLSGEGVPCDG